MKARVVQKTKQKKSRAVAIVYMAEIALAMLDGGIKDRVIFTNRGIRNR